MNLSNSEFPVLDFSAPRTLSPTDIAGYQRLEGCERFLRLRLHTTNFEAKWLEDLGPGKRGAIRKAGTIRAVLRCAVARRAAISHELWQGEIDGAQVRVLGSGLE